MEYVWITLVSLAVALLGNRFFSGSGYSLVGDLAFAVGGGVASALLFRTVTIAAEIGFVGVLIFAAIGAGLLLLLRRSFSMG